MVMCGVCNKPTKVPANNLIVQMKHGVTSAERQIKKMYLDVRNKPYIMCPRCTTPLHVDIKAAQAAQAATQASANKNKDAKGMRCTHYSTRLTHSVHTVSDVMNEVFERFE